MEKGIFLLVLCKNTGVGEGPPWEKDWAGQAAGGDFALRRKCTLYESMSLSLVLRMLSHGKRSGEGVAK